MRARFLLSAALLASTLVPVAGRAQEPIDQAMIDRIKAEAQQRSQVPMLWHEMIDVIGARLTGSPSYNQAANWARDLFQQWGLQQPRLEPFEFGRGWSLEKLTLEMTAPRYMPLIGYAEAWTPSTNGVLAGAPVYLGDKTLEQVGAMAAQLRGAIVLPALPQTAFIEGDRPQPGLSDEPVRTGNPPGVPVRYTTPNNQLGPRLQQAGAGVILRPSPIEHGTVQVQSGNRNTANDAVPTVILAPEHYNMIARMVAGGEQVELRVQLQTRYYEQDRNSYNVIAEIPGTDPALRDEVVLIGAHLDSWHTSNGATDNGDGAVGVMEAARILAAVGARPRRTIRFALWGGEEQGLLGARAYLAKYLPEGPERDKLQVFLNNDPGSGKTLGFYMQGNAAAKAIFDAWLAPLRDLGVTRNIPEGIGSTDHVPFNDVGLPAFNSIQDFTDYDRRSRHTNQDFYERVSLDDLTQSAIVMATFAWHAAQRSERIPRRAPVPQ
jgi:hypothetical protein